MTNERRTAQSPRELRRLRELHALPHGTLVLATSNPDPRYFLRVPGGWHAADAHGSTELHDILVRDLEGWPSVLGHKDLRRPVYVVADPHELPVPDELDPHTRLRLDAHALLTRWAVA